MHRFFPVALILLATILIPAGYASDLPSDASIYLRTSDGTEVNIGSVSFGTAVDGNQGIDVDIDNDAFSEHFLSMRPFRCLQGDGEWFCYLPYPYGLRNLVNPDDLSDLEYNLLFIRKTPSEFGIDAWNGLYYKLTLEENGHITGRLFEGDLNVLQSPPEQKYAKPVDLNEFIEGDSDKRLYPSLIIY